MEGAWSDTHTLPSVDGDYECKIERNGREISSVRRFKNGHWFGGCRPFSDNDVVLAWRERAPVQSNSEID